MERRMESSTSSSTNHQFSSHKQIMESSTKLMESSIPSSTKLMESSVTKLMESSISSIYIQLMESSTTNRPEVVK